MSRLYPDPTEKPARATVACLSCQNLDPFDKDRNSFCVANKKNIPEEEVTKDRHCRKHEP